MMNPTGSLRLRKRDLFESLGYEPHPGQILVHSSTASRRVVACGARWGKSVCGSMEAIAALMQPCEQSLGWVVAPTHDLATRILRRVEDVLREHMAHRIIQLDSRDQRIVVRNLGGGVSEVRGKSADRPVSLLGEACDWIIVDEAARLGRLVWDTGLSQRLVDRRGWALFLSTPNGPNWFCSMFQRGQGKDPDYESWQSPTWNNPHVDRTVVEAERARLPDDAFRQEFMAEFVGSSSEPCGFCKGPSSAAVGVVVLEGDEELLRCDDCEGAISKDGESLVRRDPQGQGHLDIVRLFFTRSVGQQSC